MTYFELFAVFLWALWVFWGLYVLLMGVYRAHLAKRLNWLTYGLAVPYLLVGVAIDVLFNATVGSLIFWERPKEWFLTQRMIRYIKGPDCWRKRLSTWVCDKTLDPFDPTDNHC